jgi:opacity protein-like surface antigen
MYYQRGGEMAVKNSVALLALMLAVLICLPVASMASETQAATRGTFISVGGGGAFSVYGIGEGISPSAQLGAGYRWSWLAIDATFLWNTLEYNVTGDELMPMSAMGNAHHLEGHHLGGIIHARAYAFEPDHKMNLYATIGVGGRVLIYRSLEMVGFPIFGPDIERTGSIWGVVVHAGIGAEFEISSNLFFDLAGMYDLTIYEEMVDSEYGTTQSINLVGGIKVAF